MSSTKAVFNSITGADWQASIRAARARRITKRAALVELVRVLQGNQ